VRLREDHEPPHREAQGPRRPLAVKTTTQQMHRIKTNAPERERERESSRRQQQNKDIRIFLFDLLRGSFFGSNHEAKQSGLGEDTISWWLLVWLNQLNLTSSVRSSVHVYSSSVPRYPLVLDVVYKTHMRDDLSGRSALLAACNRLSHLALAVMLKVRWLTWEVVRAGAGAGKGLEWSGFYMELPTQFDFYFVLAAFLLCTLRRRG